jgi:hypothetical protein
MRITAVADGVLEVPEVQEQPLIQEEEVRAAAGQLNSEWCALRRGNACTFAHTRSHTSSLHNAATGRSALQQESIVWQCAVALSKIGDLCMIVLHISSRPNVFHCCCDDVQGDTNFC